MDIYIYSDESGVFDYVHNKYFVFAGLICFSKEEKDDVLRKYISVEKIIRKNGKYDEGVELKASRLKNIEKSKLYRSLGNVFKFCVFINQTDVNPNIFENKKHKQRYLDFAYKIVLKKLFQRLITKHFINPNEVKNIYIYNDEHTTATDGYYELRESLLNEFKNGSANYEKNRFYPPIFHNLIGLNVKYCNSSSNCLIRAADIIANHFFYLINNSKDLVLSRNTFIYQLPSMKIITEGFEYFREKLMKI